APNHCSGIFPSTVRLRKADRVGAERNTATATAPVKVSVGSISKRTRASRGLTTLRCSVEQDRLPHLPTDRQFGEARLKRLALGRLRGGAPSPTSPATRRFALPMRVRSLHNR